MKEMQKYHSFMSKGDGWGRKGKGIVRIDMLRVSQSKRSSGMTSLGLWVGWVGQIKE
jgi:hypothetical protein